MLRLSGPLLHRTPFGARTHLDKTFQKIPADEFASRHGWPTSAVVHRIRAGIYEGVKEDGTWFVLRDAPPEVGRTRAGLGYTPPPRPVLPWTTVPYPILWTGRASWVGLALVVAPLALGRIEEWGILFGLGALLVSAPPLYEGLRTGVLRAHYVGPVVYRDRPVAFVVNCLCFVAYAGIGVFWTVYSAFDLWPRAV